MAELTVKLEVDARPHPEPGPCGRRQERGVGAAGDLHQVKVFDQRSRSG